MSLIGCIRKYCLSSAWNIGFVEDKVQCVIRNDLQNIHWMYLQPIITQYFIDNKSEIWLLFLIAHSKR